MDTNYPLDNSNSESTKPQAEPQQNVENNTTPVTGKIDGVWDENGNGIIYVYDIAQTGNNLNVQLYQADQLIGSGTGTIYGSNVEISLRSSTATILIKGTLSADGAGISGTYTNQITGQSGPFLFVKQ